MVAIGIIIVSVALWIGPHVQRNWHSEPNVQPMRECVEITGSRIPQCGAEIPDWAQIEEAPERIGAGDPQLSRERR